MNGEAHVILQTFRFTLRTSSFRFHLPSDFYSIEIRDLRISDFTRQTSNFHRPSDRKHMLVGADEDLSVRDRGDATARSPSAFLATTCGAGRLEHYRLAVLADEVDVAAAGDRRGREDAVHPFLPDALARAESTAVSTPTSFAMYTTWS